MNDFTSFIELFVNLFQGTALTYFAYYVLGSKRNANYMRSTGLFYGVLLAALISAANYFTIFEHFYIFLYALLIFVYSVRHLKGSYSFKILISVYSILVPAVSSVIITNIFSYLFNTPLEDILYLRDRERYVTMFVAQLTILYLLRLLSGILKKEFKGKSALVNLEMLLVSLVFFVSIIVCSFLNFVSISGENKSLFISIVFVGILLMNIITSMLTIDLNRKNTIARENEILKIQNEYNIQYAENISSQYGYVKKIQHDIRNHNAMLHSLLMEGQIDKAIKYTEEISGKVERSVVYIQTRNDIVNSVINLKLSAAKSLGIDCSYSSVSDFSGVEDYDLCSLLSNLLDNAISAAVNSTKKILSINISSDEWSYLFCVKNSIDNSVFSDNPDLKTSKSDKVHHGLGISIINGIAEKYEGKFDLYEEKGFFYSRVLLNKPEKFMIEQNQR